MNKFFFLCFALMAVIPQITLAATFTLSSNSSLLHVGDTVVIKVVLDTSKDTVNTVESTVNFPSNLLRFTSSDDSNSVLNLWIQKPNLIGNESLHFAGIAPGGFTMAHAAIVNLSFKVISQGEGDVDITEPAVLKNDGLGTALKIIKQPLHLKITEGEPIIPTSTVDVEMPEHFGLQVINDDDVYFGHSTLVFSTNDKGSGLDYYEIKEGWLGKYHEATNPYEIIDQSLRSLIYVKAVDRAGNYRIEIFYPQNYVPWYQDQIILVSILVICSLLIVSLSKLFLHFRRRKS